MCCSPILERKCLQIFECRRRSTEVDDSVDGVEMKSTLAFLHPFCSSNSSAMWILRMRKSSNEAPSTILVLSTLPINNVIA